MEDSFNTDTSRQSINSHPGVSHLPPKVNHVNSPCSGEEEANQTWKQIRRAVNSSRRFHMSFATKIPHDFSFLLTSPEFHQCKKGINGNSSNRLLFLGILKGKRENELLYLDIPDQPSHEFIDNPVEWKSAVSMFQVGIYFTSV